ncbi:hypothetical protein ABPG74_005186 [Tetrahymena malaccensis]
MKNNIIRNIENIYIHLPFCQKKCFYCSFPVHAIGKNKQDNEHFDNIQQTYLKNIKQEIITTNMMLFKNHNLIWQKKPLKSIYFGGGTPSLFQPEYVKEILNVIQSEGFSFQDDIEITMECDPGTFDAQKILFYEDLGINRISLGIQSFNDKILQNLNRPQNAQTNYEAIEILKNSAKFKSLSNVSIDLIMNQPQMTCSKDKNNLNINLNEVDQIWDQDLEQVIKLKPGHVSIYSLAIEPGSYFYEKNNFREGQFPLPSDERAADNFIKTHQKLFPIYNHYEISSYIRNDLTQPKHNPIYWEGNKDFLAFGMGASSLLNYRRYTRPKTVSRYYEYVEQLIQNPNFYLENGEDESDVQSQIESILMGRLRTIQGLDLLDIKNCYGDDIYNIISNKLETLILKSPYLIFQDQRYLKLKSPEGFLVCDDIVAEISYYLQKKIFKNK